MRIVILDDAQQVSRRAADIMGDLISQSTAESPTVLGLATGGTPVGTYECLVSDHQEGKLSFKNTITFNLDEYVGLADTHDQSYVQFMKSNLFDKVDIQADNYHLPNGDLQLNLPDLHQACSDYEEAIDDAGGIDLQLLGIGSDGHIAFNEPGSSLASRTRPKSLTERTRKDNARYFDSIDDVPKLSITMGIGTILEAEAILLLATGENKADAVADFVEGPITANVPASALQLHPHVTVLLDEKAALKLTRKDYYKHVELIQRELESN